MMEIETDFDRRLDDVDVESILARVEQRPLIFARKRCLYQGKNDWKANMSRDMTKPTNWVYAQRRLRSAWASAQSDQSSLCAQWVAKDPSFLHADSEDWSDRVSRLHG